MISIPGTSTATATAPATLPLFLSVPHHAVPLRHHRHRHHHHHHHRRRYYHRHRQLTPRLTVSNPSPSSSDPQWRRQQQQNPARKSARTLFPGGYKRPEIRVPAIVLKVSAAEVLGGESSRNAIDLALAKGVVGVVLLTGNGEGGGGRLYEAAGVVRALVGDRAYLVVDERVDVAAAVGASGVVLSDRGLPAIIARGMMSKSAGRSVLLPLVARNVQTVDDASSASSSEGADFLIFSTDMEMYAKILNEFGTTTDIRIPIFFDVVDLIGGDLLYNTITRLLQLGASGMVLSLDHLQVFTDDILGLFQSKHMVNGRKQNSGSYSTKPLNSGGTKELYDKQMIAGFTELSNREIQFIEAERNALLEAVTVIRNTAPLMEQISLLLDAIERLDQPFLMVIVGEFNSGKSTVINALLGRKYLKDGVVPTTNEITLLCYSEKESVEQERCKRHPDGQYVCHLHAPILKEMNLVDTPGTNVILQRQQRLTEEYVPCADLVLFVLSSDRPLTESEVEFLLYIQQWKKKVVFLLNKSDLYRNTSELEEAMEFVKANIRTILNAEVVEVYPVSARIAVEAKLCVSSDIGLVSEVALKNNTLWRSSGFHELENYLFSFLDGSTDTGMERMRLKLETPIGITDRLLAACEIRIKQDYELACKDLSAINELVNSVKDYAIKMENESTSWKKEMLLLIETAKSRAIKLVESILQLSNIDLVATYAFRGENSSSVSATSAIQNEIISPAHSDAQKFLGEYLQWLETSGTCQSEQYFQSFTQRWPGLIGPNNRVHHDSNTLFKKLDVLCIEVARSFSPSAAARLFDQEIREVVLGTYGGLGVAGLSASLLTSVLPTTSEDLIALVLCSTGGFLAISKFPAGRNNAIQKVTKVADALAKEIEEAMQEDLSKTVDNLRNYVELTAKPYQEAAQHKIDKLSERQGELNIVQQKLEALKMEIQNLRLL